MGQIWDNIYDLADEIQSIRLSGVNVHSVRQGVVEYIGPPRFVCTSGGFDCLHLGHLHCLRESARLGENLIVIVNGDGFLTRKKGYVFLPSIERLEIIAELECVQHVVLWDDGSQFVDGALRILKPDVFTKGGDYTPHTMAECEALACKDISCELRYGVGGSSKIQSSSWLTSRFMVQPSLQ